MTPPEPLTTSPWAHPPSPGQQGPQHGNGLAITAIVLSVVALISVVIVAALGALMYFGGMGFDNYALRGDVETTGGQVAGGDLERVIRAVIEDDGATPSKVECPERSKAGSGLSVVCDATVNDAGWVVVVVFENDQGEFALTAY